VQPLARIRRNRQRPPSNGSIERAQITSPGLHACAKTRIGTDVTREVYAVDLLRRERFSKGFDVLFETSISSVDHNMLAVPRMILAREYLFPTWQPRSETIWSACFHSGAVLTRIGTYDLNFHSDRLSASTDFEPCIARNLQWIDRIGNYCPPNAKVIFGDRIGDPIACLVKTWGLRGAISDRLLDRVDPQMYRADLTS
jgi:hypothetical protein